MEQDTGNGNMGTEGFTGFSTPCRVHFHSVRNRLADSDGISGKAVIDGLVHAGVFTDDTTKQVTETTHSQEKKRGKEYTEVTIEEV